MIPTLMGLSYSVLFCAVGARTSLLTLRDTWPHGPSPYANVIQQFVDRGLPPAPVIAMTSKLAPEPVLPNIIG